MHMKSATRSKTRQTTENTCEHLATRQWYSNTENRTSTEPTLLNFTRCVVSSPRGIAPTSRAFWYFNLGSGGDICTGISISTRSFPAMTTNSVTFFACHKTTHSQRSLFEKQILWDLLKSSPNVKSQPRRTFTSSSPRYQVRWKPYGQTNAQRRTPNMHNEECHLIMFIRRFTYTKACEHEICYHKRTSVSTSVAVTRTVIVIERPGDRLRHWRHASSKTMSGCFDRTYGTKSVQAWTVLSWKTNATSPAKYRNVYHSTVSDTVKYYNSAKIKHRRTEVSQKDITLKIWRK